VNDAVEVHWWIKTNDYNISSHGFLFESHMVLLTSRSTMAPGDFETEFWLAVILSFAATHFLPLKLINVLVRCTLLLGLPLGF